MTKQQLIEALQALPVPDDSIVQDPHGRRLNTASSLYSTQTQPYRVVLTFGQPEVEYAVPEPAQ